MWKSPDIGMVARDTSLGLFTSILQNHLSAPIMDYCLTSLQFLTLFQVISAYRLLSNMLKIEILVHIKQVKTGSCGVLCKNEQVHAGSGM